MYLNNYLYLDTDWDFSTKLNVLLRAATCEYFVLRNRRLEDASTHVLINTLRRIISCSVAV